MEDMNPSDVGPGAKQHQITYRDGTHRVVYTTDIETPYPEGKLIVSRTDTEGTITHVNDAFVFMSGYEEHELIGQPHSLLRHPDMPAAAFQDLWDTVNSGAKWNGYVKNLRKDGGFYWVFATVIPNVRNGKTIGFSSVRRKPSRNKVNDAQKLYQTMLSA